MTDTQTTDALTDGFCLQLNAKLVAAAYTHNPPMAIIDAVSKAVGEITAPLHERIAGLEANLSKTVCFYCGHVTPHVEGEVDQLGLIEHILTCEKRPERRLLDRCLAYEAFADVFRAYLQDNPSTLDAFEQGWAAVEAKVPFKVAEAEVLS